MELRDRLVAAKALIDTPNKFEMRRAREGSAIASAFYELGCDEETVAACFMVLAPFWVPRATHEQLMGVFDRAIASQEPAPCLQ